MKKMLYFFLFLLFISSCKTLKEEEGLPELDIQGYYILKNMSDNQLKQLAEETGMSLERLLNARAEGMEFAPYWINSYGDTAGRNLLKITDPNYVFDILHLYLFEKTIIINISPNPTTTSNVNYKITSKYSPDNDECYYFVKFPPVSIEFQLIFNGEIIHHWTISEYHCTTETITEDYLKEGGSYALVCNFVGPRGGTASASASFMVIKK